MRIYENQIPDIDPIWGSILGDIFLHTPDTDPPPTGGLKRWNAGFTQNPPFSGWLQSLLLLRRFCNLKKRDEIKYVYSIPS